MKTIHRRLLTGYMALAAFAFAVFAYFAYVKPVLDFKVSMEDTRASIVERMGEPFPFSGGQGEMWVHYGWFLFSQYDVTFCTDQHPRTIRRSLNFGFPNLALTLSEFSLSRECVPMPGADPGKTGVPASDLVFAPGAPL